MAISEQDRLDLRQALSRTLGTDRLANIAMEAMPPVDYQQLATKQDLSRLASELRGEMAELRGEMAELRGEMAELRGDVRGEIGQLRSEMATNLRIMIAAQVLIAGLLASWITAVT